MPDNQIPAAKSESEAAPGEFNFAKPETENPRIKRRSLKAKPAGLIKPNPAALPAARELEREAPPHSAEVAAKAPATTEPPRTTPAAKVTTAAPPRVTPTVAAAAASTTKPSTSTTPAAGPASSPHGTRPATLYYSNNTRKAENPSPMKTIPTASSAASTSSAAATATPTSAARPVTTAASRPAPNIDYRANVERQSREQKSVGNILSYIVYGLIAFFVISAGLAAYGADIIFKQLHDQSATVSDLDARYTKITGDLSAKLSATQDTLTQAQAQIARQQDLIVKQQEELNRLIAASADNDSAIKAERQNRAQETANLRARVRELEAREQEYRTSLQKY